MAKIRDTDEEEAATAEKVSGGASARMSAPRKRP
jgi:hypothetical protein